MKNKGKMVFLISIIALIAASCDVADSGTIESDDIYMSYLYEYTESTGKTRFAASFQIEDNTGQYIELTDSKQIQVNGSGYTSYGNTGLYHYQFRYNEKIDDGLFEFVTNQGKKYTNTLKLSSINSIALPDSIVFSEGSSETIRWKGSPLGAGEKVYVTVLDPVSGASTYTEKTPAAASVTIPAEKADSFGPEFTIQITREKTGSLSETTVAGGEVLYVYNSGERTITK